MEESIKLKGIELKDKYGNDMKRIVFWEKKHCSSSYMKRLKKSVLAELSLVKFEMFEDISNTIDEVLIETIEKSLSKFAHVDDVLSGFSDIKTFKIK